MQYRKESVFPECLKRTAMQLSAAWQLLSFLMADGSHQKYMEPEKGGVGRLPNHFIHKETMIS